MTLSSVQRHARYRGCCRPGGRAVEDYVRLKGSFNLHLLRYAFLMLGLSLFCTSDSGTAAAQSAEDYVLRTEHIISKIDNGEYANVHGILIWKDGQILGEKYWESWNRDRPHMLQSATKSITSLLIGIAIHEGYIRDERQRVLGFFPQYENIRHVDEHKRALTLEDLMTMRTGMDWVEYPYQESHLAQMNSEQNEWPRFVLDMPMKEAPGRNYAYNSGGTILLAGVIQEAANMSVQEFADRHLFGPLGIESAEWWFADRQGVPHTGGGLRMAAKDMLKIGRLVLNCGEWNGKQVLSCDFVDKFYRNYLTEPMTSVSGYTRGYSLLWHVFPLNPEVDVMDSHQNFVAAWGAHGQWIMVFPSHNMVAVFLAGTQNFTEETQFIPMVYEDLLRSRKTKN